jgi:acetyl esterase/lipase
VLKAEPSADPALWESASPVRAAAPGYPPFLILHGDADTLVRPGESRRLAAALQAQGPGPVGLAEIPGATHGFDAVHSLRAERAVDGIQVLLERLWARHLSRKRQEPAG